MKFKFLRIGLVVLAFAICTIREVTPINAFKINQQDTQQLQLQSSTDNQYNAVQVHLLAENIEILNVIINENLIGPIAECEDNKTFSANEVCFSVAKSSGNFLLDEPIANISYAIINSEDSYSLISLNNSGYANPQEKLSADGTIFASEQLSSVSSGVNMQSNSSLFILLGGFLLITIAVVVFVILKTKSKTKKSISYGALFLIILMTIAAGYLIDRSQKTNPSDSSVSTTLNCTNDSQCSNGFCNDQKVCKAKRATGQNCNRDSQCVGYCAAESGICKDKKQDGLNCNRKEQCKTNICTINQSTNQGICGALVINCQGDDIKCPTNMFCNTNNACRAQLSNGDECTRSRQCVSAYCKVKPGNTVGKCRPQKDEGGKCLNDDACSEGLYCSGNGMCVKDRINGRKCKRDTQCQSGLCQKLGASTVGQCSSTGNLDTTGGITDDGSETSITFDSKFLDITVPLQVKTGTEFNTSVTFKNNGTSIWPENSKITATDNLKITDKVIGQETYPNQIQTIDISGIAPNAEGIYFLLLQLSAQNSMFGDKSFKIPIEVTNEIAISECTNLDADGNGQLTLGDFGNFAQFWLKSCTEGQIYNSCGSVDTNSDAKIDLGDFAYFATKWQASCIK